MAGARHGGTGHGAPDTWIRTSDSTGIAFAARELVDADSRQASVDICSGQVFVSYARDHRDTENPNRWKIELATRAIGAVGFTGAAVSSGDDRARDPDVACAGGRLFVAWVERRLGFDDVLITDELRSTLMFDVPILLGPAVGDPIEAPVVAGTSRRAYVAWQLGDDVRFKRFGIGSGPGYPITPFGDVVVGPGSAARPAGHPQIGAAGERVVVAWTRCADLLARVSTDRGASWGPVRRLVDLPCGGETGAVPSSVAIIGERIAIAYHLASPAGDQERVIRSRDDLAGWTDRRLGSGADAQLYGFVTYPEALGWVSARDAGARITYIRHGNTTPLAGE